MSAARVDTTRKRKKLKFRQQAATCAALVVLAGVAGDMRHPGEGIKREATGSCFLVSPTVRTVGAPLVCQHQARVAYSVPLAHGCAFSHTIFVYSNCAGSLMSYDAHKVQGCKAYAAVNQVRTRLVGKNYSNPSNNLRISSISSSVSPLSLLRRISSIRRIKSLSFWGWYSVCGSGSGLDGCGWGCGCAC